MQFGCLSQRDTNRLWRVQEMPCLTAQEERDVSLHALQWTVACNRLAKAEDEKAKAIIAKREAEQEQEDWWRYGEFEEEVGDDVNEEEEEPAAASEDDAYDSASEY